jgi:hypothetical protein
MESYTTWLNIELNKLKLSSFKNSKSNEKHFTLHKIVSTINKKNLWLEFGVWKGDTINYIATQNKGNIVYGFDSFEGLPETWSNYAKQGTFSLNGNLPNVQNNVKLIKGLFKNTLPFFLDEHPEPVNFLHIDCDLYSSTKDVLNNLINYKRFIPGTIIIFDELINYNDFENHEIKAFYEMIKKYNIVFEWIGTHNKVMALNDYNKYGYHTFKEFRNNGYGQEVAVKIISIDYDYVQ